MLFPIPLRGKIFWFHQRIQSRSRGLTTERVYNRLIQLRPSMVDLNIVLKLYEIVSIIPTGIY